MKVFAIASIPQGVTIEQIQQLLPKEVPATLKHYLDGKIELMPVTTLARSNFCSRASQRAIFSAARRAHKIRF